MFCLGSSAKHNHSIATVRSPLARVLHSDLVITALECPILCSAADWTRFNCSTPSTALSAVNVCMFVCTSEQ